MTICSMVKNKGQSQRSQESYMILSKLDKDSHSIMGWSTLAASRIAPLRANTTRNHGIHIVGAEGWLGGCDDVITLQRRPYKVICPSFCISL